jgi:hypothetical protein
MCSLARVGLFIGLSICLDYFTSSEFGFPGFIIYLKTLVASVRLSLRITGKNIPNIYTNIP